MNIKHALIMAAGRGMRMMPLTDHIPKAMAILDGKTLISTGIEKISKDVPNIHITVGYKGAMLASHVITTGNISSIFNTEGKGNSWWLFNTLLKYLDEPVLVLTCDNVVELNLKLITEEYYSFNEPACMVVPVKPVEGLEGDYIFHNNNKVIELNRHKVSDIYCSGIQVLKPSKINSLINPEEDFYKVWNQLIKLEELFCSKTYPDKWYAVDTIEQLNALNLLHKKNT